MFAVVLLRHILDSRGFYLFVVFSRSKDNNRYTERLPIRWVSPQTPNGAAQSGPPVYGGGRNPITCAVATREEESWSQTWAWDSTPELVSMASLRIRDGPSLVSGPEYQRLARTST